MAIYNCECGKESKEVLKAKIILKENKWVADVICACGKHMDSKPTEGMPQLIRTEDSLSKNKKREKLWKSAKEKLSGERGINESFK